jgi:hypothetical protein
MRDVLIGTVSGVSAVIAMTLLMPRPQPAALPVREIRAVDVRYDDLAGSYLPATQPDPVRQKLVQTSARINVKEMRFDKVVTYLSEITGANFYVDWRALEAAGIDSQATVTLDLQGVPVSAVLKAALKELGGGTSGNIMLAYQIDDGVVKISTADDLAKETSTRIYDVRDLIEEEVVRSRRPQSGRENETTEQEATDGLARLLQEAVDPTTWRDAGGSTGGLRAFAGRLIVTQTPDNHDQSLGLLTALRHASSHPAAATQGAAK